MASRAERPPRRDVVRLVVGGERFELPRLTLAIASPGWVACLDEEAAGAELELDGDAASFGRFCRYLLGAEGAEGEVTAENVLDLLQWGEQLGIDYIPSMCESFLSTTGQGTLGSTEMLEVAAHHNMPLLYKRATELAAQGTHHLEVHGPLGGVVAEGAASAGHDGGARDLGRAPAAAWTSREIRDDIVDAHISMNLMRGDGEMRRRHRFADHTGLADAEQRARLLWKSRHRVAKAPTPPPEHDWRKVQAVWPHHSLRGADWLVVPCETQPSTVLRIGGLAAVSNNTNMKRGLPSRARQPVTSPR